MTTLNPPNFMTDVILPAALKHARDMHCFDFSDDQIKELQSIYDGDTGAGESRSDPIKYCKFPVDGNA